MENKSMIGHQPRSLLLIFGMTVALLVSTSSSQIISASVDGGSPGPDTSNSNQGAESANKCTVYQCIYYQCIGQRCLAGPEQSQGGSQGTAPGSNMSNSDQGAGSAAQCTRTNPHDPPCPPNNAELSQDGSQGGASGSGSSGASSNPNQQAIDHINQAQSSLQNGDTEGAQRNMDLAKNALHCVGCEPTN